MSGNLVFSVISVKREISGGDANRHAGGSTVKRLRLPSPPAFPAVAARFHYNARDFSDFRPSAPF